MKSYNLAKDIKTIREVFNLSQDELAKELGISRSNIIRYEKGEIFPHKGTLEAIYSYAYEKGLLVNKAKTMLYEDEKGDNILLFHGAKETIEGEIDYLHLNGAKDFGAGFYLGLSFDSSASWISDRINGSCYCFYLKQNSNLKFLEFNVNRDWMYAILYFRGAFSNYKLTNKIKELIDIINNADVIIAPIANNNMYETLNSFAYGQITDEQCLHALSANNLGLQYVFKSKKACESLVFIDRLYLCESEKKKYLLNKKDLAIEGRSKANLAINEYRRKGNYFDELFKKNG